MLRDGFANANERNLAVTDGVSVVELMDKVRVHRAQGSLSAVERMDT